VLKLDKGRLGDFLQTLCRGRAVYALEQDGDQYHLVRAEAWDPERHVLGAYRPVEPLKSLVFPPRERVGAPAALAEAEGAAESIVVGAKNCDVSALRIHDFVLRETAPADPYYALAREKTLIVSCDCTDAREVCFCPAVGEQPYVKEGSDINLAATPEGILVEALSRRGADLLRRAAPGLPPADEALAAARDAQRARVGELVRERAASRGLKRDADLRKAVRGTEEHGLWDEFAEDCVECGACNLACCTCHCFLLADGRDADGRPARLRQWDSCLYLNFARVAGGANPRRRRAARLYNRFDKKFNFFPEVLGRYACDGCGRCAEACTGRIDIRDVLKRALDAA